MTERIDLPKDAIHAVHFDMVLRAEYTEATENTPEIARWRAVTSTTKQDRVGEHTTPMLYHDWVKRIEKGIKVPFLPDPMMPFLSVSHYADFGGLGVAGSADRLSHRQSDDATTYIFEAAGRFNMDNPLDLGRDLLRAAMQEQALVARGDSVEEPMRVSAAWFDLCHRHGDQVFVRQSLNERCPLCEAGVGDKYYMQGQLVHFAVTRVPINPDTPFGLEEKSMPITKQSDAESLVSEEAAKKLDELERFHLTTAKSSAAMTVKAEGDGEEEVQPQEPPTLGAAVRSLRAQNALSFQTVARSLSITEPALEDIEQDKLTPAKPVLQSLARLFDVQPLDLVRLLPKGTAIPETVERMMMNHYGMEEEEVDQAYQPNPFRDALDRSNRFDLTRTPRSFDEAERYKAEHERLEALADCLHTGYKIILNILEDAEMADRSQAVLTALRDEVDRAEGIVAAPDEEYVAMSEAGRIERAKKKKDRMPPWLKEKIAGDDEEDDPEKKKAATGKKKPKKPDGFSELEMDKEEDDGEEKTMSSKSQTQIQTGDETMPSKLEELAVQVGRSMTETADNDSLSIEDKYRAAEESIGGYAAEVQRAFLAKSNAQPQSRESREPAGSDLAQAIAQALTPALAQLSQAAQSLTEIGQQMALQIEKARVGQPRLPQQNVSFNPETGIPTVQSEAPPPIRKSIAALPQQPPQQHVQAVQPQQSYGQLGGPSAANPTPSLRNLIRGQYRLQQ